MFRMLGSLACLLALASPAAAEVGDAQPYGLALKYAYDIAQPRAAVYCALADVSQCFHQAACSTCR